MLFFVCEDDWMKCLCCFCIKIFREDICSSVPVICLGMCCEDVWTRCSCCFYVCEDIERRCLCHVPVFAGAVCGSEREDVREGGNLY